MGADRLRPMDPKKVLRGAVAGTVLSVAAVGAGIFGIVKDQQSPINQRCNGLTSDAFNLTEDLIKSGSLGVEGGLFSRHVEIRNPMDPKVSELGQLKNRRDDVCAQADDSGETLRTLSVTGVAGGLAVTLIGVGVMQHQRQRMKKEPAPTTSTATL